MKILISRPGSPTKVSIMILKVLDHERIKVGEVVVDPQMHKRTVITNGARQPLQRVHVAREVNVGVQRGVAHRSARR
eukprot:scaffold30559_cov140-Isochrysis_galbana.AAC.1